jgi:hypothetical protein
MYITHWSSSTLINKMMNYLLEEKSHGYIIYYIIIVTYGLYMHKLQLYSTKLCILLVSRNLQM